MIPYGRQTICDSDIAAVVEVLKSDFLTQGPKVPAFEELIANTVDVRYAVATNSATSALHLACMALEVTSGDTVWTTPISFVASANCALYCGASIEFVDIDPFTFNISAEAIEEKLNLAALANELPKAIIVVHMAGRSCDMKRIKTAADEFGVSIIEDASHALGGSYLGEKVGSCKYSDITVFSFHPVKIITSGEGGMATTNSRKIAEKLRKLRSHGITRDTSEFSSSSRDAWHYEQLHLGFNYRMNDLEASLGISQSAKLEDFVTQRSRISRTYHESLLDTGFQLPLPDSEEYSSAWHLYVILVSDESGETRRELFRTLVNSGIGVNVHYEPIHLQPYYRNLGWNPGSLPAAESYAKRCITLPIYPGLKNHEQHRVVSILEGFGQR